MIIGTAGHIDHGKTSLVKALTGVDADRLPEEKARGITIDLGFAYAPNARGETVGFVDVPGHEKFVHTMAAGATGIDHGLVVVAADDGIMPQTKEHLRILDLLGVPSISLAITKTDLVGLDRSEEVRRDLEAYIGATRFQSVKTYLVSTKTGSGVDVLKNDLFSLVDSVAEDQAEHFRLAIDRVFVVKGVGVAVTGAVIAGRVHVGDTLLLGIKQHPVKVRSIHAQNQPSQDAGVGTRCGIVISGVEYTDVERGDWLVAPELAFLTQRFDCEIDLPHDAERLIKDGEQLLLHHGTEHLLTRIIVLNAHEILPGQKAFVQCSFDKPLSICWQDRVVFRDSGVRHTLAGGLVLDVDPPVRGRKKPERQEALTNLANSSLSTALLDALLKAPEPINLSHWASVMNRSFENLLKRAQDQKVVQLELDGLTYLLGVNSEDLIRNKVNSCLAKFHVAEPDEPGLAVERLRRMSCPSLTQSLFKAWVGLEVKNKTLSLSGSFVHLPDHRIELSANEKVIWERIYPRLVEGQYDPPWVRDLASALNEPEANVRLLLRKVSRTSGLVQLVPDLFYPVSTMRLMADIVRDIVDADGHITVISFKDRVGLGRKRAIQILEAFDRLGFTRRLVSYTRGKKELEKDHRILRNTDLFASEVVA